MRWLPKSLKSRLTIVVGVLVLGSTVLATLTALLLAERDMKTVIGNQQFAAVSAIAASIDDRLRVKQSTLSVFAQSLPDAVRADPARLHDYVRAHPAILNEFFNIAACGEDGQILASVLPRPANLSARGKPYFEDTLRRREGLISAPFRSALSGRPVVLLTHPLYDQTGKLQMVLIGGIDLESAPFVRQLDALRPGRTGFFYMMTFDGILIEHPDRSRLLEHINAKPGVNAATQRALAGFEGWTEARNKAGSEGIYAYKRLGNVNWIVAARFPTEEAFAPLIAMRGQTIAAGAMFALLAAFLGWYAVTRMVAPLQRLREHVGSVRAHRADLSVLKSRRDDEVGELARSFHALVADRQSAQERTRDSEALVRNILDRAPDAFISTDADGRITEWNGRAEELFGWTREEALGRDVADLIIPEYMRAAHKAGMARFGVTGSGPVINTRMRVTARHRNGRSIPIEISVGAVPHEGEHYATAFLHDISDRLAYEEQIKASERRARIIADTMPILISYVDDQERFQFTNAYYQELLGVDPRSLIGKTVLEVRGAATYDQLKEHIDAALRGQRVHFEHEGVENGRHVYFIIDYIPDVAPDGRVAGFYSMVTDISERRGAELRQAASEKRLKLITDHMPALIAYIDSEGRFQFGNATFRTWFGIAPEEMAGRPLDQVITARTLDLAQDHLPRAFAGQTVTYEFRAERNGHSRDLRLTLVPDQQPDGVVAGVYALAQDMTDVKAAQEKLIQLARIDSLTGIANRRSFGETLAQAVERARRHHLLIALAYLDVDHFKKINDTYGHATGDEVLKEFAHRMVASVRSSDIVARLSGDEFVIILGDLKEAAEAATIAQKIVDAVRVPFELAGATVNVTTSVGIAVFEGGTQTQVQLLANADKALYEAKRLGRNGFAVYTPAAGMEPAA